MNTTTATRPALPTQPARRLRLRRILLRAGPLIVGVSIALPLVWLLVDSFNVARPGLAASYSVHNWTRAFADRTTFAALRNSITLGLVRTLISLPIALALAWLIARSDMPGRGLIELLCWLGIFMPVLPVTFGWILLLDPHFGLVNTWIAKVPFIGHGIFNIYGFWGIVWVHLASTSVSFKVVLLTPAFRRVGAALEDAARICGADQFTTMWRITIPLLAPAVLLVALLSFVISLEVFEVELLLGAPVGLWVYSTRIYDLIRQAPPEYGEATALGFVFLVILLVLAVLYQWYLRGKSFASVTGQGYRATPVRLGHWRWPAAAICFGYFAMTLTASTIFLVLGSFMRRYGFFDIVRPFTTKHWEALLGDPTFWPSVQNSLIIGVVSAVTVVLLYSLIAYALVRRPARASRVADMMMWVPWAVPGILMSLGLLWLFLSTPLRGALYGSLLGLIVAMVIRSSPLSTQFYKAAFLQIAPELEEGARVSGASWLRTYWRVLSPLLASTAVTVGLITFLSVVNDISTSVLLYSPQSRPLSILMLEYGFSGELERAAGIGVLLTAFAMLLTLVARGFGLRLARETV